MKPALPLILLALATAMAFLASTAYAQTEITEADPVDSQTSVRIDSGHTPRDDRAPRQGMFFRAVNSPDLPDTRSESECASGRRATADQGDEEDDDGGPDILFLALITIASAGGAAVLGTLGYLLRRRIGYEPHRPPEGGEEGGGDH